MSKQLSFDWFTDPNFCMYCGSLDRLKPGCIFPHKGGDRHAYKKKCLCETGRVCEVHKDKTK